MPIQWNLRKWLAVNHDIYRPAELQRALEERTGVRISPQAIGQLLRGTPKALKMATVQSLCTAFNCRLSDFCDVVPGKRLRTRVRRPYAAHGRGRKAGGAFPDPSSF